MDQHNINRKLICIVCISRAERTIQEGSNLSELVGKYVVADYLPSDPRLPNGICSTMSSSVKCFRKRRF